MKNLFYYETDIGKIGICCEQNEITDVFLPEEAAGGTETIFEGFYPAAFSEWNGISEKSLEEPFGYSIRRDAQL